MNNNDIVQHVPDPQPSLPTIPPLDVRVDSVLGALITQQERTAREIVQLTNDVAILKAKLNEVILRSSEIMEGVTEFIIELERRTVA